MTKSQKLDTKSENMTKDQEDIIFFAFRVDRAGDYCDIVEWQMILNLK